MNSIQTDKINAGLLKTVSNLHDNKYQDVSAITQIRDLAKNISNIFNNQKANVCPSLTNIKESYQFGNDKIEIRLTTSAHTVMSNELPSIRDTSSIIDYNKFITKIKSENKDNEAYVKFFSQLFNITNKEYCYRVDEQDGIFTFTAVRPKIRHVVELELITL